MLCDDEFPCSFVQLILLEMMFMLLHFILYWSYCKQILLGVIDNHISLIIQISPLHFVATIV